VDRGGTDYNRFRERYDGFHAGEDWSGPNGRNLGSPVYAIGHGRVVYAHPFGWGVDQGVLILQHVFADGSTILSFYGHLDPPSITLRGGECVARGEQVGAIGDPRGRPHLHFEIRNHTPNDPGPGYWFQHPRLAGWLPPSLTIWANRLAAAPGYLWAREPLEGELPTGNQASGLLPGDVLVLLEQNRLHGVSAADGAVLWTQPDPPTPTPRPEATLDPTRVALEVAASAPVSAALDDREPFLYAIDRRHWLQGYTTAGEAPTFEPLWQTELDLTGIPALYALPGGGVVATGSREAVAMTANGQLSWRQQWDELAGTAVRAGDILFLPVGRGETTLWSLAVDGAVEWPGLPVGTPLGWPGHNLWLYAREGIYRLERETRSAELVMLLPRAFSGTAAHGDGAALALPDGGLLVAHRDLDDQRLLRLDAAGNLLWERSYQEAGRGPAQLALNGNDVYLALEEPGATTLVTVFAIDQETGNLTRLFVGGTRQGLPGNTWLSAVSNGALLVNIGGGHLVALDPRAAVQALAPAP
jgi:outer membrane protein assembly factor BamB